MSVAIETVRESFIGFANTSYRLRHIQTEEDYQNALGTVEQLLTSLDDTGDDPLNDLIDIISKAIEAYENKQPMIQDFVAKYRAKYNSAPKGISVIRVLMDQYGLGVNDFQNEIGSKSYVSMIMNEERQLNKKHIEKLCKRFNISPELFF